MTQQNKYEEVLKEFPPKSKIAFDDRYISEWSFIHQDTIREALQKAAAYDAIADDLKELVDAREKATQGEWHNGEYTAYGYEVLPNNSSSKTCLFANILDRYFTIKAANIISRIKEKMEEKDDD